MTPGQPHPPYFPLSLQVAAEAWQRLELNPKSVLADSERRLFRIRQLTEALRRHAAPERPPRAGELNLLALLNRALRHVAGRYLELRGCRVTGTHIELGGTPKRRPNLPKTLGQLIELFPPAAVWLGGEPKRYLSGTQGERRRLESLIELFILAVQNGNRAARTYRSLFADDELARRTAYRQVLAELDEELEKIAVPGVFGGTLLDLLLAPLKAAPDSLAGQLGFIRQQWAGIIPEELLQELEVAFAILHEEEMQRGFGTGGPLPVPTFGGTAEHEVEAFSPDTDWMPKVVLIAKTIYVWLDQLSKRYQRPIHRLDDIPEEELDRLARWGFNALWLIGLWQRSPASRKIKRICGNPEAEASAYSLFDYAIADDLGGDEALARLEERCLRRGIRLASDIVPNHTGLDSKWMREHPDWFIQLDHPPYPAYQYHGPDLYDDPDVTVQIEDGYYDHSDAAVVFRHQDHRSGRVRYIYHGNDGTHMPWNDTAQLNYLIPEVREAMIRTIIGIARRFRVIRFDAAMTLAKKHFQRLWFPLPGGGQGVPSRAEHWLAKEAFDAAFPVEFWREVVDRVAAEVPDTLLIAEAFWLMEGYFVRTLGMHRVYNSAFMNMLKREDNGKYRQVLGNILEFEPGILQRFVNFMNNPDEDTAVAQFGKADKYFGVAVMLATLPGLPMFGHGQIEGFEEKYGMEYRRAYYDEVVDDAFVRHHEAQIFPLLQRRRLFSGAENFELFDFFHDGRVNDNVFAYSNGVGAERALVLYHNHYGDCEGRLHQGLPRQRPNSAVPRANSLAEALGVRAGERWYCRFREHRSGLEYLRTGDDLAENGLFFSLGPYQYRVCLDFVALYDEDGAWGELYRRIGHAPVADLDRELRKIRFRPVGDAFRALLEVALRQPLAAILAREPAELEKHPDYREFLARMTGFVETLAHFAQPLPPAEAVLAAIRRQLDDLRLLSRLTGKRPDENLALAGLRRMLTEGLPNRVLLPFLLLRQIGGLSPGNEASRRGAAWIEEYLLGDALQETLADTEAPVTRQLVTLLVRHQGFWLLGRRRQSFRELFGDPAVREYLRVHWHEGMEWFNQERWDSLLAGLFVAAACSAVQTLKKDRPELLSWLTRRFEQHAAARQWAREAGFKVAELLRLGAPRAVPVPARKPGKKLKILMISSEVTPFAKSGGLADVAGSLPRALRALGHDVRIILPYYRAIARRGDAVEMDLASAIVPLDGTPLQAALHQGDLDGVPVYFVEQAELFDRDGLYGGADGDFWDNAQRFGFFDRAVLALLPRLGFKPDILHLNDWQTGLIPALLRTEHNDDPFYAGAATVLTIHNLGYQGLFGGQHLETLDLDPRLFGMDGLEYHGMLSFLKAGLTQSDLLTTVSETYCREIRTPEMGIGFDGILRGRANDLFGIVNGLDPEQWNPAADPALPEPYDADNLSGKGRCKAALQRELGLNESPDTPIVAMITRLATQKGLDIVEAAWDGILRRPLQFVLLGTGEKEHMERFERLRHRHPGRVSINLSFDDDLSRRIYAGSDLFLMPSRYEPCGLGQLIALRYGVIPIARRTGGLADTIVDPQEDWTRANGYLFDAPTAEALLHALDRALGLHARAEDWNGMVRAGMRQDFSWERSAERYLELYRRALAKRRGKNQGDS